MMPLLMALTKNQTIATNPVQLFYITKEVSHMGNLFFFQLVCYRKELMFQAIMHSLTFPYLCPSFLQNRICLNHLY